MDIEVEVLDQDEDSASMQPNSLCAHCTKRGTCSIGLFEPRRVFGLPRHLLDETLAMKIGGTYTLHLPEILARKVLLVYSLPLVVLVASVLATSLMEEGMSAGLQLTVVLLAMLLGYGSAWCLMTRMKFFSTWPAVRVTVKDRASGSSPVST